LSNPRCNPRCWNFDAICSSSSGITLSGFGGHIAISGCLLMLQTNVDTFGELAMVVNPRFAVEIQKYHICEVYIFALQAYNAGSRKTSHVDVRSKPAT